MERIFDRSAGSLTTSIANVLSANIPIVASTGDDWEYFKVPAPACISGVIPVAQCDLSDKQVSVSNSASFVKLMAPGAGVVSSIGPSAATSLEFGSSLAAPHVAGAIALIRQCDSTISIASIYKALVETAAPGVFTVDGLGRRRLQVDAAVAVFCP